MVFFESKLLVIYSGQTVTDEAPSMLLVFFSGQIVLDEVLSKFSRS
jgi:hypothetical protein